MTRMSKQQRRRAVSPRKHKCKNPAAKTGPKKDALPRGFREHVNAASGDLAKQIFIPRIV